jgi:hypothetical protein
MTREEKRKRWLAAIETVAELTDDQLHVFLYHVKKQDRHARGVCGCVPPWHGDGRPFEASE